MRRADATRRMARIWRAPAMKATTAFLLALPLILVLASAAPGARAGDFQLRAKADEPVVVLDKDSGRIWLLKTEAGGARMVPVYYDDGSGKLSALPPAPGEGGVPVAVSEPAAAPEEAKAAEEPAPAPNAP